MMESHGKLRPVGSESQSPIESEQCKRETSNR
jgi:hypothetical protein